MARSIDYLNIDSDVNYYNTIEQIRIKSIKWFADATVPSILSGSQKAIGFFSSRKPTKNLGNTGVLYVTSSTVVDLSGTERKILSSTNDYLSGSTVDTYKQGVEITQEKHWTTGLAKISAGTPGHLYDLNRYGITDASLILEENYYTELEVFNPVHFVETGGIYDSPARYPLFIKSDFNQPEKLLLDGAIEPFVIRTSVSNFTPSIPFEPRSFKGQFGNGNTNWRFSSDQVVSVDYRLIRKNRAWYMDDYGTIDFGEGVSVDPLGNASIIGCTNQEENYFPSFSDDKVKPRGSSLSSNYGAQLSSAILDLPAGGTTYVSEDEVSSTCGYTYDNAFLGTDSIAYGGMLY